MLNLFKKPYTSCVCHTSCLWNKKRYTIKLSYQIQNDMFICLSLIRFFMYLFCKHICNFNIMLMTWSLLLAVNISNFKVTACEMKKCYLL